MNFYKFSIEFNYYLLICFVIQIDRKKIFVFVNIIWSIKIFLLDSLWSIYTAIWSICIHLWLTCCLLRYHTYNYIQCIYYFVVNHYKKFIEIYIMWFYLILYGGLHRFMVYHKYIIYHIYYGFICILCLISVITFLKKMIL